MSDEKIREAALAFVWSSIGFLNKKYRWDKPERDALASLRESLNLCRNCGGNPKDSKGSMLKCICTHKNVYVEDDEAERLRAEPDPDYYRDSRRNED